MKNLYLHVGCGKTGTSALQVWLSQIAFELKQQGIIYPLHNQKPLGDYAISSGNGTHLHKAITKQRLERFFQNLEIDDSCKALLYSSELLQILTKEDSDYLKKVAGQNGFEVHIIAFVRDVYDMTYSSFQQLVKRHTFARTFRDFALRRTCMQQFSVVGKLGQWFENMHVVHYDTLENGDLSLPICQLIAVEASSIPKMSGRKVNRSLTVYETELMRLANRLYREKHSAQSMIFSASLSDRLIALAPEAQTEILFDERVYDHLSKVMQSHVDRVNSRFFGEPRLQIFREEGKNIVRELPVISEDLERFISVLMAPHLSEGGVKRWLEKWARKFLRQ